MGPLRRAAPCGGSINSVRPATLYRLMPAGGGYLNQHKEIAMQNHHAPVRLVISLSPETFCGLSNIAEEYGLSQNEVAAECVRSSIEDWVLTQVSQRPGSAQGVAQQKEMHS